MGQTFDQMKMINQLRKAQKELRSEEHTYSSHRLTSRMPSSA